MIGSSALSVPIRNDLCIKEEQKDSSGGPSPIDGKANERVFFNCFGGILGLSKTNTDTNLYGLT
jgi:hypothetical protein